MRLKKELTFFDMTNIVIGSIVGADIYIASALAAPLIGPFSVILWVVAGIFAMIIALVFAYCSYYVPKVGGPFAFVSKAFDDFYGFLTGWSMYIAEILALPVFAIAFVNYFQYFLPLDVFQQILVKGFFLFALTLINVIGVKTAGRLNDVLTIIKMLPLALLILAGLISFLFNPISVSENYAPLAPLGFDRLGTALVLIFWAYAGFEIGSLPASEVKNPKKMIPKAIITGMLIVTAFYVLTNFVMFGLINWQDLARTTVPMVMAGSAFFGVAGAVIMTIGALASVSGCDESEMLGTARLSYAMSIDGLFPKVFSKVSPKYRTPEMSLMIQGIVAFILSIFSGIRGLISFAIFNLGFSFLLTCLALVILKKGKEKKLYGQNILPWIGIAICAYLIYSTTLFDKIVGSALILLGIPLYIFFSPKVDAHHLKRMFISEESLMERKLEKKERFLANFIGLVYRAYRKIKPAKNLKSRKKD